MRRELFKILVTGGAGFIGSEFARQAVSKGYKVIVVDKLTYAGDIKRLYGIKGRYIFYKCDICDATLIDSIFKKEHPQAVVNFAAETHVDRSIKDAAHFIETNIKGVRILMEASRKVNKERFIQISTDEVFGEIEKGSFSEDAPLKPNSPYAASKAAADLLIKSYIRTYSFPAIIIRPCNNYGPWQYPEKLIPVIINRAMQNKKIPVYAKGLNVREWLYVSDCAEAILLLFKKAKTGEVYNVGSGHRQKNIDVVKQILKILNKPVTLIELVKDRLGHDWRYALDSSKIQKLGWRPKVSFALGIKQAVAWNIANRKWLLSKVP